MDHETLWQISRRRHIFDKQIVKIEKMVKGIQNCFQSKFSQGILRNIKIHRQSFTDGGSKI